jgi:hypothetical protein
LRLPHALAADEADHLSAEGNINDSREHSRVESSQPAEQVNPIVVSVADDEHRCDRLLPIPAAQFSRKAFPFEDLREACELADADRNESASASAVARIVP